MQRLLNAIILLIPLFCSGQLTDDFSDGNFTLNPVWTGDIAEYKINSSQQLQLNNSVAGASYLSASSSLMSLDNIEWRFFIHLGFSPSSSNYARVYLVSDQSNLEGPLNGYYLQLGEALSNDALELFKQTGSTSTSIARGTAGKIASAFSIGVKITRDSLGLWQLSADYTGGSSFVPEASGLDSSVSYSSFFGLAAVYTSSNSSKVYFDDVYVGPVAVDSVPPSVSSLNTVSSYQLDVLFNEPVDKTSSEATINYWVDNGIGNPFSALRDSSNPALVHLQFSSLFSDRVINNLSVFNVKDLAGNPITGSSSPFFFHLISEPQPNDIVINEILFDPRAGGYDFLELYNRSDKTIDLMDLVICEKDTVSGALTDIENISASSFLLYPGEYLVLTENPQAVRDQYIAKDPEAFLAMNTLPAMNVSGDVVVIADKSNKIIDKVAYKADMHYPLLEETKGVSLERIDFDRASGDRSNWHSAAEDAGFGTPGYKNSQYSKGVEGSGEIVISPEIFSPDNNGEKDVLNISYDLPLPGFVGNLQVYDSKGRLVKSLVRNELLGISGTFSWDGTDDQNQKAAIGIYIIYFEAFDVQGDLKKFKKTCVLAGNLR